MHGRRASPWSIVVALVAAACLVLGGLPRVEGGFTSLTVTAGSFSHPGLVRHPYVYVPGETVNFTITGDVPGEPFDATVVQRSSGMILRPYDNQVMPPGLSLTLTYVVPSSLWDGDDYEIEVGDSGWIESGRTAGLMASQRFAVQAYELAVRTDRPAYLGGDAVTVTWAATLLRDGSPAPDGFGQMWMFDANGVSLIAPPVFTFSQSAGGRTFTLPDLADPRFDGFVFAWFNDTVTNPIRFDSATTTFEINRLGVLVEVPPPHDVPGTFLVEGRTFATENQASPPPSDPPEPGMFVDVTLWEITPTGPVLLPEHGAEGLVTDADGRVNHTFTLNWTFGDGATFEVRANASHPNGIWRWSATDAFTVRRVEFVLTIATGGEVYRPGIPVGVHYRLSPKAPGPRPPASLGLVLELDGGHRLDHATSDPEGDVLYTIPQGVPDGPATLTAWEAVTGTVALASLRIDGTPPTVGTPSAEPAVVNTTFLVTATVEDASEVTEVVLHWRHSDGSEGTLEMVAVGGGVYSVTAPPFASPGTLDLWVSASDVAGNRAEGDAVSVPVEETAAEPPAPVGTDVWVFVGIGLASAAAVVAAMLALRYRRGKRSPPGPAP